ncbi:hypothetical protein PVAP13_8KG074604 [Panicum virgatum]|uniref:Uncharacterized protein n=1 Tax=Panicum virgatum TaxID=38727 RepID=A0A8T0PJU0_PANVG|nr:hypothetical protein PVAP13_8KG074604 [Panicum virgatum]
MAATAALKRPSSPKQIQIRSPWWRFRPKPTLRGTSNGGATSGSKASLVPRSGLPPATRGAMPPTTFETVVARNTEPTDIERSVGRPLWGWGLTAPPSPRVDSLESAEGPRDRTVMDGLPARAPLATHRALLTSRRSRRTAPHPTPRPWRRSRPRWRRHSRACGSYPPWAPYLG